MLCPVCRGRGEVEAGLTTGKDYGAPDDEGVRCRFATQVFPNPAALINNEIWFLEENPLVKLWGIAVCGGCRGTGATWPTT